MLRVSDNITDRIPGRSLKGATEFLEQVHWFLYVKEAGGRLHLYRGHTLLFEADNVEAAEAFVYGAVMAYLSLPEALYRQFQERFEHFERPSLPGLRPLGE